MTTRVRAAITVLEDAGWLLLLVFLTPLAILILGSPFALLGRLLVELAAWL